VCTAHGTSIALIGQHNQEILACTDYEYKFDKIFDFYKGLLLILTKVLLPF
jgi:hypothetical protein